MTQDELTLRDRIAYAISHDSGTTWSDKDGQGNWRLLPMPSGYDATSYFQFDPTVAFDSVTGAFAFSGCNPSDAVHEQPWRAVAGTMPTGQDTVTFSQALSHAEPPSDLQPNVKSDFPHIAADSRPGYGVRYFIVCWEKGENAGEQKLLAMHRGTRNIGGSITWGARENLLLGPGQYINGSYPTAAVANDGSLYVAYATTIGAAAYKLVRRDDVSPYYFAQTSLRVAINGIDGSNRVGGLFPVRDYASVAVDPNNPNKVYVAYADSASSSAGDQDVEVYLTWSNDRGANWNGPVVISDDPGGVQKGSDQFFPAICVDAQSRVHIVFYDTRDHPSGADESSVKIGLYYCWAIPDGQGGLNIEPNVKLDDQTINTDFLTYPGSIGDYLSITAIPWTNGRDAPVVAFMGTNHPRFEGHDSGNLPTNETIFSQQIVQNN